MRKTKTSTLVADARKYFQKAQKEYVFSFGKKTLFNMCSQSEPKDANEVASRLWLIGRSHAAALERRKNPPKAGYLEVYEDVADDIVKDSRLAVLVHSLNGTVPAKQSYDGEKLALIHEACERLTGIFQRHTKERKISLASKYLHFHAPVVPIYDTLSVNALTELVRMSEIPETALVYWKELPYGRHLARFAAAQAILRSEGYSATAAEIDIFLLYRP